MLPGMSSRRHFIFQVTDVLFTASMLVFDALDVRELQAPKDGPSPDWAWFALGGFLVFAALSLWSQWDLIQRLHPERQVKVTATGELEYTGSHSWRSLPHDDDNERITEAKAAIRIAVRNRGERRIVLTEIFVEIVTRPRWWWPRVRVIDTIDPNIIDNHSGLVDANRPRYVKWLAEPEGDEILHAVDFWRDWARGAGPKYVRRWDMRLVVEYGGGDPRGRGPL